MGCRCNERADALRRVVSETARGDIRSAGRDLAFVGKTLRDDLRSGAIARLATQRLALLRRR